MDCFEPIFGFLRSFWFQKNRSDTWDPKGMFSAPSGHSDTVRPELLEEILKALETFQLSCVLNTY